jgi:phosphoribosyl 1,2-cyclic phosphate phosphodiesterase
MKLIFLGTGTSTGVPQIGCTCKTCLSKDGKDKRLRASVLITENGTDLLIDCGPDFRQQMLTHNINRLSHVLITHEHYDHIGGLDDIRPMGAINVYGEQRALDVIKRNMPYCFKAEKYPGTPVMTLKTIEDKLFYINGIPVQPIRVMHAKLPVLGYRIKNMAYLTDVKTIGAEALEQLKGLDVLILSALRPQAHISHLSLNEALLLAEKTGARKTYFTHMSHDMGQHNETNRILPQHVELAYDGLELSL